MSKIICDICGTAYPETAKQCPICGCVRPGDAQRVADDAQGSGSVSTGYTYVRGGRFSKSNVKKRTKSDGAVPPVAKKAPAPKKEAEPEGGSNNRGLVITAVALLLAIVGVVLFLAIRFFAPIAEPDPNPTETTGVVQTDLSCKDIILDTDTILLEELGSGVLLNFEIKPANTSDPRYFRSENEAIATVSDAGKVTAVSEGTTKIIITCGDVVKEWVVICKLPESTNPTDPPVSTEPTVTTDPTETTEPTKPAGELRLNRSDITFSYKGEKWDLYSGTIAKNLITWTSDDPSVVTFESGVAVAIGPGQTNIHAEYEGQKVSCIIRCSFKETGGVGGTGGVTEDGGGSGTTTPTTPTTPPETESTTPTTPDTSSYTVQTGDTLSAIAAKYGVTVPELAELNHLENPNELQVGQILQIPN